ncbi:hypothetical protein GQX73_g1711 [Xylaria multiplex]|uniref:EKC/KEOPS complex subunit BUD32 n=1 Tax=Xylaria multiplex TaxID=323545 RepID=A0A7C8NC19_9PEZI|nr:hypothetical protein GQX73_g1711 [Xylaria multiplex]
MLHEIIEKRKADLRGSTLKEMGESRDLLTYMLEESEMHRQQTGQEPWTTETIIGHLLNFTSAGHESTATSLSWALYVLSTRHEIQDHLRAEIQGLLKCSAKPTLDEINGLPYLHNFVREVLRVYAPSLMSPRQASKDLVIEGVYIPKGTRVDLHMPLIHHHKGVWGADASVFRPERWEELTGDSASLYAFQAFIQGPRICPGKNFAVVEIKAMLIELVSKWRFIGIESSENRDQKGESDENIERELLLNGEEAIGRGIKLANPTLTYRPASGLYAVLDFAKSVEENYENAKYWEFEKLLGAGGYGVAILAREKEYIGAHRKRIAIKLAQPAGVRALQKEIEWLKRLNGAKHIVEMRAYCDDLIAASKEAEKRDKLTETIENAFANFGKLETVPPITAFDTLAGVKGPALGLEYIEGGDLLHFIYLKLRPKEERPPNRVLWSLFFCFVRATIGMAYPIGAPIGTPAILETIPDDGRPARHMVHGDLALRNVMIGPGDDLDEHYAGQTLKLIDFGLAFDYLIPRNAPQDNIYDCAEMIVNLFDTHPMRKVIVRWENIDTRAGAIIPMDGEEDPLPKVDLELRRLIARCMDTSPYRRPPLEEVLRITTHAVLTRKPDSFPEPRRETDSAIREWWQQFMYNA